MRASRRTLSAAVAAAITAAALPTGASAAGRSPVDGSRPSWATTARDRGRAPAAAPVSVTVFLPLRDPQGAEDLLARVSDPASADHGRYLTPQQFTDRFAASPADADAVASFLRGAGLTVDPASSDRRAIRASGTLGQAEAAFATTVHRYAYRGRLLRAPAAPVTVPSSLGGKVLAVGGLAQAPARPLADTAAPPAAKPDAPTAATTTRGGGAPPPPAYVNAPPCSRFFGERLATEYPAVRGTTVPYAPCGYTPAQYQGAYDTAGLLARGVDGRGVTVAITDAYAAPTILRDANTYATAHGEPAFADKQFQQLSPGGAYRDGYGDKVDGDLCGEQGWYGEETLDVEAVHAMAPGANVLYVPGRSCDDADLLDALHTIIADRRADIITNSWGSIGEDTPADLLKAYHDTFLQAGIEGIGVFFSSGDDGDDSLDTADGAPAVDFPASEPLVTSVGGTALGVGANDNYLFETGWATGSSALAASGAAWSPPFPGSFLYGGGGGVSRLFAEPSYQRGVVPDAIARGRRAVPDVALDGDPQTGMLIGETQSFRDGSTRYSEYRIGGTSLASPLMAGMEALADQAAGTPHGFANPALYRLAGSAALRDVAGPPPVRAVVRVNYNNGEDGADGTSPFLRSLDDEAQSLHVTAGWDDLTGLGSPDGAAFAGALGR